MYRRRFSCLITYLTCLTFLAGTVRAQTGSNKGTEFWTAFPSHESDVDANFDPLPANLSVFVTSDRASSGVVTAGSFSQTFQVTPNEVTEIKIPHDAVYIDQPQAGQVLNNRAVHVQVNAGMPPVVMYAHIFAGQRSAASLILPREALGQTYFSMNYQQQSTEGKNYIVAIATEPHTLLHFRKGNTELIPGGVLLDKINDVYEYLSANDLTGVSVSVDPGSSCHRFAVFSGSTGLTIGRSACTTHSLDPLFQQLYPVENWGRRYGFIPFSMHSPAFSQSVRTAGQYVRVLAKDPDTRLSIGGQLVTTLNQGEYYTSPQPLQQATLINADKPVCVAQYALSQSCANTQIPSGNQAENYSDPDMVILNPLSLDIDHITVYSSMRENISEHYLNVLMKTSASSSFRINNLAPTAAFRPVPGLPEYSYLQLLLDNNSAHTFTLTADEGFNAIAYGFGNVESYAYAAGTSLILADKLSGIKTASQQLTDSACVNEDFSFRLTLPYQAASIDWQMDQGETTVTQNNPSAMMEIANGAVVYHYAYPRTPAYQQPGWHHATVTANYVQNGNCAAGSQRIHYDFLVLPAAQAGFEVLRPDCPNTIIFKDRSLSNGTTIISRHWDFADPYSPEAEDTSNLAEPQHTFSKSGTYPVTLVLTTRSGCQSMQLTNVTIDEGLPQLTFDPLSAVCHSDASFLLTQAREITGVMGTGFYSGDGVQPDGSFDPLKAGAGQHRLSYTFTKSTGCSVTISQNIEVLVSPSTPDITEQLYAGESIVLKPAYQGDRLTYAWSPATGLAATNIAYPLAHPTQTTQYQVLISNGICSYVARVKVEVLHAPQPVTAFTPNGDGVNDYWEIAHILDFPQASISVYNRYGTQLFFSKGFYHPWDGRFQGQPVPWGVYYYIIETDPRRKPLSGPLTVIR